LDEQALALVRIDGASLVANVAQLRGPGALSALGQGLHSALLSLPPGADHALRVTLEYASDAEGANAESVLRDTFGALGRSGKPALAWLGVAKVERDGRSVRVAAPLPDALTDALLGLTSGRPGSSGSSSGSSASPAPDLSRH
jgi:hypothetical protein